MDKRGKMKEEKNSQQTGLIEIEVQGGRGGHLRHRERLSKFSLPVIMQKD